MSMVRWSVVFYLFVANAFCLQSGSASAANHIQALAIGSSEVACGGKELSVEQAQADITTLQNALLEAHPGVYRYISEKKLAARFDHARSSVEGSLCPLDLFRILAPVVGAIKDGHTALGPPAETAKYINSELPLFPFEVRILGNRIFLTKDYSGSAKTLRGAELMKLNGRSAERLLHPLLASIRGDADSVTAGPWRLANHFLFSKRLFSTFGIEPPYDIDFRLNGVASHIKLQGVTASSLQMLQTAEGEKSTDAVAEYRRLTSSTALLRISHFGGKAGGEPLSKFLDRVFNDLTSSHTETLILDVRNNGGGEDELGAELFAHFTEKPFTYYRDLVANKLTFDFFRYSPNPEPLPPDWFEKWGDGRYHLTKHPNWGVLQPKPPQFRGKVIILMNGGSFSTTCEFLAKMKDSGRAILVGEQAGGSYTGNTSGPGAILVLPNSKLQVPIHLLGYYMAVDSKDGITGTIDPDIAVRYTIDDVLQSRDLEMDEARKLARQYAESR